MLLYESEIREKIGSESERREKNLSSE